MSLSLKQIGAILACLAMTLSYETGAAAQGRRVLYHVEELPPPQFSHLELSGRDMVGTNFTISLNALGRESIINLSMTSAGASSHYSIAFDGSTFPDLDFLSINSFGGLVGSENIFKITLKYGRSRPECFVNDDGRNYVYLVIHNMNRAEVSNVSYENCEPTVSDVTMSALRRGG